MPFEHHKVDGALHIIFSGEVTAVDLRESAKQLRIEEDRLPVCPDRLTDITLVDGRNMNFLTIEELAAQRRTAALKNKVKSAILTQTTLQYGLARMFQTLNDNPMIEIAIFKDRDAALAWLAVGAEQRQQSAKHSEVITPAPSIPEMHLAPDPGLG
jgi:hypothetical protein